MGAGMSSQYATMGKIRNWGIEASLRSMNIKTKDFSWSTNLQFTLSLPQRVARRHLRL